MAFLMIFMHPTYEVLPTSCQLSIKEMAKKTRPHPRFMIIAHRFQQFHSLVHPSTFLLLFATAAQAQLVWQGDTDSDFNTGSNYVGDTYAQWTDYVFDSNVVNGTINVDDYTGWGNISLNSGLTSDIMISGSQPVIMYPSAPWGGGGGNISIAADSRNLTINNTYLAANPMVWNVGSGRTLTVNGSFNDWNGQAHVASLTKQGEGTVILAGNSNFSGGTTINGGIVEARRSALGSGAVTINNGGTLYANDQWVLCSGNPYGVNERNIGTLTINAGGTLHLDVVSGFANGINNLILNGGSVINGNNDDGRGALYLWNGNQQITAGGAIASTIGASIGLTGTNNTITVESDSTLTISESLKNSNWYGNDSSPGGIIKAGNGMLILSGANSYSSGTVVNGGTLKITLQNQLPGSGGISVAAGATLITDAANDANTQSISSIITLNGGTLAAGEGTPSINFHSGNPVGPWGNYYLAPGASIQAGNNSTSTISANLGVNGSGGYTPINVDGGSTLIVSGKIYGVSYASWGGFSKSGAGTLVLSGDNKAASQGMILSGGTVEFSLNSLPTNLRSQGGPGGYSASFQGDATLRWAAGNTQDISFENGSTQINIADGVTATFDTNGNNVTLGSAFALGSSQTAAMTKSGTGTLTLSAVNQYKGDTTVYAGTLSLQADSLDDDSSVVIASGAVLDLAHGFTDRVSALIINGTPVASGIYSAASAPTAGYLTGTGSLEVAPAEPFATWINASWPTLDDKDPSADPDHDGIPNIIEYVLHDGEPSVADSSILPAVNAEVSNFVYTFHRRNAATVDTTQVFQYCDNLADWTNVPISSGGMVSITADTPAAGIDEITVTIPKASNTKIFGRLQITK
jgi:autotransporter-associated beta strand protein